MTTQYLHTGALTPNPGTNDNIDSGWRTYGCVIIGPQAGAFTITGILAASVNDGPLSGPEKIIDGPLCLMNISGQACTISHQSVASTAANRIDNPATGDYSLADKHSVFLMYDYNASSWRIIS